MLKIYQVATNVILVETLNVKDAQTMLKNRVFFFFNLEALMQLCNTKLSSKCHVHDTR